MTANHLPRQDDIPGTPSSPAKATSLWRYWALLTLAGILASAAMVQTFGSDVSAATLEPESAGPAYDAHALAPAAEVTAAVPLL